jgi:hypothetical protein
MIEVINYDISLLITLAFHDHPIPAEMKTTNSPK